MYNIVSQHFLTRPGANKVYTYIRPTILLNGFIPCFKFSMKCYECLDCLVVSGVFVLFCSFAIKENGSKDTWQRDGEKI